MPPIKPAAPWVPADFRARRVRVPRVSENLVQTFNPLGPFLYFQQAEHNPPQQIASPPFSDASGSGQGARFLVGFNVGVQEVWDIPTIVNLVFSLRREQLAMAFAEGYATPSSAGGDIAASFVAQQGLWQTIGEISPHPEKGVQILILNNVNERKDYFVLDMDHIAIELATQLQQQAVLVEHTKAGVVVGEKVWGPRS